MKYVHYIITELPSTDISAGESISDTPAQNTIQNKYRNAKHLFLFIYLYITFVR